MHLPHPCHSTCQGGLIEEVKPASWMEKAPQYDMSFIAPRLQSAFATQVLFGGGFVVKVGPLAVVGGVAGRWQLLSCN